MHSKRRYCFLSGHPFRVVTRYMESGITSRYNTIQYNSLLTLPWWGFSVTMRLKKKLIKIREVVNNSIKRKECGEQSNINIPI